MVPLADRGGVLRVWSAASGELRHSYRIDVPATLRWQANRPVVLWPDLIFFYNILTFFFIKEF